MTPLIPREVLFGNPTYAQPRLSPDGRFFSYIAPDDGVLNVWVRLLEGGEPRAVTHDRGRGIRYHAWAMDSSTILTIQDKDGDENWHVYAVAADGSGQKDLTPYEGIQAQVVGLERDVPNRILVALNLRNEALHDVHSIDLPTGECRLVEENPGDVVGWVADRYLNVVACAAQTPEGGWQIRGRPVGEGWRACLTTGPEDEAFPLSTTSDGASVYVVNSQGFNTKKIGVLPLSGGAFQTVAGREDIDVGEMVIHPTTRQIQAVAFDRHRTEWEVLDDAIRSDFQRLIDHEAGDFYPVSRTDDDNTWVIAYSRDTGSDAMYLYDRQTHERSFLFTVRPELDRYELAPMRPVDIPSRDGLVLPSYLTLPVGRSERPMPMVLNVHGGPWARDAWGYDAEAQWFANRGYACLQVNFRGSEGFGKSFVHAGDREWGGKMLDDLLDAVQWAVDNGIADPEKVAIFGGSYGGYACLAGLTFAPDVFVCGVDIVGPSNLITFLQSIPAYWEPMRKLLDQRVGKVDEDEAFLKSRSPLFHVDRIQRPLLVAQGANDPRVVQAESEQMVAALREAGKTVEYMLFEDEGHGFARPENRLRFYAAAEEFLQRYLGGRKESPASA